MSYSEVSQREALLADAWLRRRNFDSCYVHPEKPYPDPRHETLIHGKYRLVSGHRVSFQSHGKGHQTCRWRTSVRDIKDYRTLIRLEDAAAAKNELAFVNALEGISLGDTPAAQLARIIKLALKAGAYLAARRVAEKALKRYPNNSEFQEYTRSLSPPKVISQALPHNPAFQANREWLNKHAAEYSGKWVALRSGDLLGSSVSFDELFNQIGRSKEVLFTRA